MTCVICKRGETEPGVTTVTFERDGAVVMVRGVPADICADCGEAYVSGEVGAALLASAEAAMARGAHVQINDYVAA